LLLRREEEWGHSPIQSAVLLPEHSIPRPAMKPSARQIDKPQQFFVVSLF